MDNFVCLRVCIKWPIGLMVRVFANGPRRLGFNPRLSCGTIMCIHVCVCVCIYIYIYIYIYMGLCVYPWMVSQRRDSYLQHLWAASDCLEDLLCLSILVWRSCKELCLHEPARPEERTKDVSKSGVRIRP